MSEQTRHEIIMPALGMTQDTGEILSWSFELGALVQAGDILFEVETDKTTVEVEAGSAGVIVEVRAAAGEAVPVGSVIAVIDSDVSAVPVIASRSVSSETGGADVDKATEKDINPSRDAVSVLSNTAARSAAPETKRATAEKVPRTVPAVRPVEASASATPIPSGRILASPKAKLAARDKGISLEQMAAAGIDQPLQFVDVQNYVPSTSTASISQSLLQARIARTAYKDFLEWADKQTDTHTISGSVWSLFASSAWRYSCAPDPIADVHVEFEQWSDRASDLFTINADRVGLLEIVSYEANGNVDMLVRDMTGTPLTHYQSPYELACPSLTVVEDGSDHLNLSLRFNESSLSLDSAMSLLNRVCQLVEQPLRHLL
jgi:hypothetical protein